MDADPTVAVLRGDLPRLARATSIVTESAASDIKRSKPLKYAYEKEIVLYAHHKKLDYFSTECIYSPEAFRGSARALIKNLEQVRPSAILDVVRSGEDMARCVPEEAGGGSCGAECGGNSKKQLAATEDNEDREGGCGSANGRTGGNEMAEMEKHLQQSEAAEAEAREIEITSANIDGQRHDRGQKVQDDDHGSNGSALNGSRGRKKGPAKTPKKMQKRQMGQCQQCGYLSSQAVCKACMLLEGLNKNRPDTEVAVGGGVPVAGDLSRRIDAMPVADQTG